MIAYFALRFILIQFSKRVSLVLNFLVATIGPRTVTTIMFN